MKIVVFAGGVGTRLWPLSRKNSPKQFEKILGDKSTLQLAVDRLRPDFAFEDIYIATGKKYEKIVRQQLPKIPAQNFIFEPAIRDVGPAVGMAMSVIGKEHPNSPVAILWSDHLVRKEALFRRLLKTAGEVATKNPDRIIFIAQKDIFGKNIFNAKAKAKKEYALKTQAITITLLKVFWEIVENIFFEVKAEVKINIIRPTKNTKNSLIDLTSIRLTKLKTPKKVVIAKIR